MNPLLRENAGSLRHAPFMTSRNTLFCFLSLNLLFFSSCKKDEDPMDIVPSIEFVSITPGLANEYTDAVTIRIRYTDGDGDLGENDDAVSNCFVTDNRIGITSSYRIRQLAPDGASIPIKGVLDIEIGGLGITDGSVQQNASFDLYLTDRAGHNSNRLTTGTITIRKP
jgi:hypothetical protein